MFSFDAAKKEAAPQGEQAPAQPGPACGKGRGIGFVLAVLGLTVVTVLAGTGLARWLRPQPQQPDAPPAAEAPILFRGWPAQPDLVFLMTGQMHGYMLPCGCSDPQKGGLERRYNFLESLKARNWPVFPIDLGDIAQKQGPVSLPNVQGMKKYEYSMRALKAMGYQAVSFGEYEANLGLDDVVAYWPLNNPEPRFLSANLLGSPPTKPSDLGVYPLHVARVPGSTVTVGVTAIVGPLVAQKITDPNVKFSPEREALTNVLKQMADQKVDFRVLLYHGTTTQGQPNNPPETEALAQAFPGLDLMLCLSETDEPNGNPVEVRHGNDRSTVIVSLGHKSKYVGVLGIFRTGRPAQPVELKYQLVELTPYWATPANKVAGHPILKLMEQYTAELKEKKVLESYPQVSHPMQVAVPNSKPTYVGSERCRRCHESAYAVWKGSDHAKAYQSLEKATKPSNRQYDPECIVCHTVGFGYKSGFQSAELSPAPLRGVGCESCHGPASEHLNNVNDPVWHKQMNPWKAPPNETAEGMKKRTLRIAVFCQTCHDSDNDVHWTRDGFANKWHKIEHPTPP